MRRHRALIWSCVALVTVLAWAYLIHLDHRMAAVTTADSVMERMGMATGEPWNASDVFFTFAMWAVMMVGMMAPAAAPVILIFTEMRNARGDARAAARGALFGVAHVSVWIGFAAAAALLQWALHQAAALSPSMTITSSRLAGAMLIAAGAYQLSPVKGECLRRCQNPLGFLVTNWRDGASGALQLGIRHGVYCLGCCWALMLVLFITGVMNLVAVAALTAFILLEKLGPSGAQVAQAGGAAMILSGAFILLS